VHATDGVAQLAQADATIAYNSLAALSPTMLLTGQDLGGMTLGAGVYGYASSAQLTGTLTIDFAGLSNTDVVFKIGSTLTTASGSNIVVENGNATDGIYFQVGSSATLGSSTTFAGNILADQSITLNSTAKILCGRAIALNAAVTMDTNTISYDCSNGGDYDSDRSDFGSQGFIGSATANIPEPTSVVLLSMSLLGLLGLRRAVATAVKPG
jgi:type VI secretion system secreted protein VgrG